MKKFLIAALLTMSVCHAMADNNDSIMGTNGKMMPIPVYGSIVISHYMTYTHSLIGRAHV